LQVHLCETGLQPMLGGPQRSWHLIAARQNCHNQEGPSSRLLGPRIRASGLGQHCHVQVGHKVVALRGKLGFRERSYLDTQNLK
jgi:hypothetical protein